MSTTIHSAFRVSADTDLLELSERLRAALIPHLSAEFRSEAVSMAVREFDDAYLNDGNNEDFATFLRKLLSKLVQNLSANVDTLDKYDLMPFNSILKFHVVFLRNTVRNETYAIFSQGMLDKEGEEIVLGVEGIESDFSYWNGSDSQLEYLTEEEWETRKVSWGETIDRSRGISEQGLVAKFFDNVSPYKLCEWKAYEEQSANLFSDVAHEERFRRLVFYIYLNKLRSVYPDLDIMDIINKSFTFLNPKKELDYDMLPLAKEQEIRLEKSIQTAEQRVSAFPIEF